MRKELLDLINKYENELRTIEMEKTSSIPKFLSIETYDCTLSNGEVIKREKIVKGKKDGSAAIVLPLTENNEFIVAIEPRVFTKRTVDIGFPAGYIENGEKPEDAARRELLEETGYKAEELVFLGSFYQDQGCSGAYNYYYLATGCKKVTEQNLDDGEFIKYLSVSEDELDWLFDNNYIEGLNSAYTYEKTKRLIRKKEK